MSENFDNGDKEALVEVERKFALVAGAEEAIAKRLTFVKEVMRNALPPPCSPPTPAKRANRPGARPQAVIEDRYYDTDDFRLTTQDLWLRSRDGAWELKLVPARPSPGPAAIVSAAIHRLSMRVPAGR